MREKFSGLFPVLWLGLIAATYLDMGEYYLIALTGFVLFLCVWEFKTEAPAVFRGDFIFFILYYILISAIGILAGNVSMKNFIELNLKYVCIPLILSYVIPLQNQDRVRALEYLRLTIFVSAVYGLLESVLKYNFVAEWSRIDAKSWMEGMASASSYQPYSFFSHYNYYGCVLVLGLILGRYLPFKNKLLNLLYHLVLLEQLFVCQSRICWISAVVIYVVDFFLRGESLKKLAPKLAALAGIALCVLIVRPSLVQKVIDLVVNRFSRIWTYGFMDGSVGQRLGTLLNWPEYFSEHILAGFLGTGYHSTATVYLPEYSYFEGYSTADCQITVYLVETGLVGMLLFAIAVVSFLKRKRAEENAVLTRIAKLTFLAFAIESLTLDLASNNIMLAVLFFVLLIDVRQPFGNIALGSRPGSIRFHWRPGGHSIQLRW